MDKRIKWGIVALIGIGLIGLAIHLRTENQRRTGRSGTTEANRYQENHP